MDIKAFLSDWLEASNSYDIERYMTKYRDDAVLDDPSVGKKFVGHTGIRAYFTSYFIGYKTQTQLETLTITENRAHMKVAFTGNFPGGHVRGMFDFTFKKGKIAKVKAALL